MKNTDRFIAHVKAECKYYGIKLELRKTKYLVLEKRIKCGGYFDETRKVLVVATKTTSWFAILVHEFAHLTQWVDNCKPWQELGNSLEKVSDWLNGKEVRGIKTALAKARDLELDNEKRTVKLIRKWNLPIDIKEYTQKANAYVQLYNWMYYTRRWCSVKNSPYRNSAIYKEMPSTFRMNYKIMPEKYKKLYERVGV